MAENPGVTAIMNSTADTFVAETESRFLPTPQYRDLQAHCQHSIQLNLQAPDSCRGHDRQCSPAIAAATSNLHSASRKRICRAMENACACSARVSGVHNDQPQRHLVCNARRQEVHVSEVFQEAILRTQTQPLTVFRLLQQLWVIRSLHARALLSTVLYRHTAGPTNQQILTCSPDLLMASQDQTLSAEACRCA